MRRKLGAVRCLISRGLAHTFDPPRIQQREVDEGASAGRRGRLAGAPLGFPLSPAEAGDTGETRWRRGISRILALLKTAF